MSLKILKVGTSGEYIDAEGLNDGSLITVPWVQAQIIKGKGFHAYTGAASTPVTLDASWAATDPDIAMDIPDGRIVIPLKVITVIEAYGTTALFETMTLCSRTLGASSAGTAFQPINLRTRKGGGSACTVYNVDPTVTSGYTTGAFELYRATIQKAVTLATALDTTPTNPQIFEWAYNKQGYAPLLEGNASMATWATCQAATGYIYWEWLEFEEGEI